MSESLTHGGRVLDATARLQDAKERYRFARDTYWALREKLNDAAKELDAAQLGFDVAGKDLLAVATGETS